ncbi:MAG: competence/damage-inducible protein A [Candidatus Aminicenantales bacterium]
MKIDKDSALELIIIGSELLTPYFTDKNSIYLTRELNSLGMEVTFKTTVGDDLKNLMTAIRESLHRAQLIFATGGLGPTRDDNTREAFAEVLQKKLIFDEQVLRRIEARFRQRGIAMPAVNRKQAYIIEGAEVIENQHGTAPGMWLETESRIIVLLPGPPHELVPMCENSVWPRLRKMGLTTTKRKIIKMADTTESEVESQISDLYQATGEVKISTLAYPGQIEIHLSSSSEEALAEMEGKIKERIKEKIFSTQGEELEEVVGLLLRKRNATLAVAESCTGGLLGNRLTNVPGSSDYFILGVVAYSNEAKIRELDVPSALLIKKGAVSEEVALAMARGVRIKAGSAYGLGITGIAGPGGGSREKPVGLVHIACDFEEKALCSKNIFLGSRERIKFQATQKALDMLRKELQKGS